MSPRIVLAGAISALLLSVASISYGQIRKVDPGVVSVTQVGELPSLLERVSRLEQRNSQLEGQVSQLQHQLAQSTAASDKNFFADRFRITALEANQKQGGTTGQLDLKLSAVASRVTDVEAKVGALSNRFATHTHTYGKTTFGWWGQQMHDLKVAQPAATSGPN